MWGEANEDPCIEISEKEDGGVKEGKLEIQRRVEDDRIGSFEHLGRLVELLLELNVPDRLGGLSHLPQQFLETTECSDEGSLEPASRTQGWVQVSMRVLIAEE